MACVSKSKATGTVSTLLAREYGLSKGPPETMSIARSRYGGANDLYKKDLYSHFGCVNAIEFSTDGEWLVSGGDDRRVLLWNLEKAISDKGSPVPMKEEHNSNIFCLSFDSTRKRLFSAGNDEQVIVHDVETGVELDTILHMEAIYGLSVDPMNDDLFATACNDGSVFIWDLREADFSNNPHNEPLLTLRSSNPFHAVMHNPVDPRLVVTANTKDGIALWDLRNHKKCVIQYTDSLQQVQSAMSVRFNNRGTQVLGLRRRFPPILYNLTSPYPIAEFDHVSYYNSCTMKSCCFAGSDDEYVLSGSDDFKLYMWKIPDEVMEHELSVPKETVWVGDSHLVLEGHRSIVNQVRYNYRNGMIASSGVEKVIKLWSVFTLPNGSGGLGSVKSLSREPRRVYSHEDYINLVLESGQLMTHDYSHHSVQEDPRMMAFFDSLVQRDIEGWTSSSSDDSDSSDSGWFVSGRPYGRMRKSSSDSSSSDSDETSRVLNEHTLAYLKTLKHRIDERTNDLARQDIQDVNQPSSSRASQSNHISSLNQEANKISQLIHEKKRDQLRKVARVALKNTKKRLKRVRKSINVVDEEAPGTSHQAVNTEKYSQLNSLIDRLNSSVENDTKIYAQEHKSRRTQYKSRHRRLRYLTDQSDIILNEVYPSNDSTSDSDDSQGAVSADEFLEVISNNFQRIRSMSNRQVVDSDSSDSDTTGPLIEISDSDRERSSRNAEPEVADKVEQNDDQSLSTGIKIPFVLPDDSDDEAEIEEAVLALSGHSGAFNESPGADASPLCTLQSGPFVKMGSEEKKSVINCICRPTSSTNNCQVCQSNSSQAGSSQSNGLFKAPSHNRTYRKRKHSGDSTSNQEGTSDDKR
ncbi:DDB1- and CUL4-associated factor 5 [Halotydeus destructor]|nr:DDB1- and CUL4-associated factor 5 [Halotydeus destructor]